VYSVLDNDCLAVLLISAPALLALKFFLKERVPWWVAILSIVTVSTAVGIVRDKIGAQAHFERFDACIKVTPIDNAASLGDAVPVFPLSCGPAFYHVSTLPLYLKWIPGLALLALTLPFYGLAIWLRARRAPVVAA
jgi:hypothetical protein